VSSSLRRGAFAATAIAFSIASLAACGAGHDAETLQIKPDNAAASVGPIKVQNAVVVTQPGTQTKGPAVVIATLFNNGKTDQTLDSISVEGGGTARITPAGGGGKLTVPAGGSVVIGGKGNAVAELPNPSSELKDGNAQKVTFAFSETGDVSLRAFVVPAEGYYSSWGPSSAPAAPGAPGASQAPDSEAGEESKAPEKKDDEKKDEAESSENAPDPSGSASQSASAGH
jgi:copper(I)-binding protein